MNHWESFFYIYFQHRDDDILSDIGKDAQMEAIRSTDSVEQFSSEDDSVFRGFEKAVSILYHHITMTNSNQ